MARAAPIRCSPLLPCPLLPPPPNPLPLLVTGSGVTARAAGTSLAFWSVHLCQHPARSLLSLPHPSCGGTCAQPTLQPHRPPQGEAGRGGTGHRAAEVERLVGKARQALFT